MHRACAGDFPPPRGEPAGPGSQTVNPACGLALATATYEKSLSSWNRRKLRVKASVHALAQAGPIAECDANLLGVTLCPVRICSDLSRNLDQQREDRRRHRVCVRRHQGLRTLQMVSSDFHRSVLKVEGRRVELRDNALRRTVSGLPGRRSSHRLAPRLVAFAPHHGRSRHQSYQNPVSCCPHSTLNSIGTRPVRRVPGPAHAPPSSPLVWGDGGFWAPRAVPALLGTERESHRYGGRDFTKPRVGERGTPDVAFHATLRIHLRDAACTQASGRDPDLRCCDREQSTSLHASKRRQPRAGCLSTAPGTRRLPLAHTGTLAAIVKLCDLSGLPHRAGMIEGVTRSPLPACAHGG